MKVDVEFERELTGHRDSVYTLASAGEESFFSAGGDGLVVKWDLQNMGDGEAVASLGSSVYSLGYFSEADRLIVGTRGGRLFRFDLAKKVQTGFVQLTGDVFGLQPLQDGGLVAATGGGYIYRLNARLEILNAIHPSEKSARSVISVQDGSEIATGWSDGKIRILDAELMKERAVFTANEPSVFSLLAVDDYLVSGGRDAQLKVWNTKDYSLQQTVPAHWFTVNHLVLSPNKKIFASASRDKSIKIWDASTFELLKVIDLRNYPAHTHSVNRLLWTSYENYLISAGDDRKIKIWRVEY